MDLGTVKRKLEGKMYYSANECMDDIARTFNNCYTYNKTSDDIVVMCEELEKIYKKKLAQMPAEVCNFRVAFYYFSLSLMDII